MPPPSAKLSPGSVPMSVATPSCQRKARLVPAVLVQFRVACPLFLIAMAANGSPPVVPISIALPLSQRTSRTAEKLQVSVLPTTCPLSLFPAGPGSPRGLRLRNPSIRTLSQENWTKLLLSLDAASEQQLLSGLRRNFARHYHCRHFAPVIRIALC